LRLIVLSVVVGSNVLAQTPAERPLAAGDPRLVRASVAAFGGFTARSGEQQLAGTEALFQFPGANLLNALQPGFLQLQGSWYALPWLGVALDARLDSFSWQLAEAMGDQPCFRSPSSNAAMERRCGVGGALLPAGLLRTFLLPWLSLEARAGWMVATRPLVERPGGAESTLEAVWTHGPSLGGAVSVFPAPWFAARLFGRIAFESKSASASVPAVAGANWALGGQLNVNVLRFERVQAGVALMAEHESYSLEGPGARLALATSRFGVGVNADWLELPPPPPPAPQEPPALPQPEVANEVAPSRVAGVVRNDEGAPLAQVLVETKEARALTDEAGRFTVTGVEPGVVVLRFRKEGYRALEDAIHVPVGGMASFDVVLIPSSARTKAVIRGIVSNALGPVPRAVIRIDALKLRLPARSDGRFETQVPGGQHTLVIEAPGHVTQSRIVTIADGDQAIFQIELEPQR
jgi:hypothetical protein